jgi:hypothetical protein
MAQKKKASRAKKRVILRGKRPRRSRVTITGQSLRLAAKQANVQVRRTAEAYVGKAAELEAARLERQEAERALGLFHAAEAASAKRPFYNFLAQGDSWFDYTCGKALIPCLCDLFGRENAYFENIAASGRTLRQMLSRDFKQKLTVGPGNGQPWNAVLLCGGGNDICGDHRFRDWLKRYDGTTAPEAYITNAFDHEVGILKGIYEEAIDLVGKSAKGGRLFVHDYDFAIPDNRCVTGRSPRFNADLHFCFAGPWMWPAFEERGFHRPGDPVPQLTKDIVTAILKRFADMLTGLERKYPNQLVLVRTQGVLTPIQATGLWVNELHPYDDSFQVLAKPFYDKLHTFF